MVAVTVQYEGIRGFVMGGRLALGVNVTGRGWMHGSFCAWKVLGWLALPWHRRPRFPPSQRP